MSRRKRYAAIALAVTAIAVPATAAMAAPRDSTVTGQAAVSLLADHKKVKLESKCLYPPQSQPTLDVIVADRTLKKGKRAKFTAQVSVNECDVKGMPVALYKQDANDGGDYKLARAGETDKKGKVVLRSAKLQRNTTFYLVPPGGSQFVSVQSRFITVTVR